MKVYELMALLAEYKACTEVDCFVTIGEDAGHTTHINEVDYNHNGDVTLFLKPIEGE